MPETSSKSAQISAEITLDFLLKKKAFSHKKVFPAFLLFASLKTGENEAQGFPILLDNLWTLLNSWDKKTESFMFFPRQFCFFQFTVIAHSYTA